jgi:hypothetical protein
MGSKLVSFGCLMLLNVSHELNLLQMNSTNCKFIVPEVSSEKELGEKSLVSKSWVRI